MVPMIARAPGGPARRVWLAVAAATLCLAGIPPPAAAQVARPKPEHICRALAAGDKHYPQYRSCCDVDGSNSRWIKADGTQEIRVFTCALMGVTRGSASLDLPESQRPVDPKLSAKGIPPGAYKCHPAGSPIKVTVHKDGRYGVSDGSSGRLELAERSADGTGGFARYRISGGSLDGFFFLHRDNGQLQLGRVGWTRCEPQ